MDNQYIRIPKAFFTDEKYKGMTAEAKLLYGLMLDRMSLSQKNGKTDPEGLVYIYYTYASAMDSLDISNQKCTKVFRELEGSGLISRKKQKLGSADVIYVSDIISSRDKKDRDIHHETHAAARAIEAPAVHDFNESRALKSCSNNTELNQNDKANVHSIHLSDERKKEERPVMIKLDRTGKTVRGIHPSQGVVRSYPAPHPSQTADIDAIERRLSEQLEYDVYADRLNHTDSVIFDELFSLVRDVMVHDQKLTINGYPISIDTVREQFSKLRGEHLAFVIDSIWGTDRIRNVKNPRMYIITALYNAPMIMRTSSSLEVADALYRAGQLTA